MLNSDMRLQKDIKVALNATSSIQARWTFGRDRSQVQTQAGAGEV